MIAVYLEPFECTSRNSPAAICERRRPIVAVEAILRH
jgi:hypothetical protein